VAPKAVIAEDEPLIREEIRAMLHGCWPELDLVAECGSGDEALDAVARLRPDVLFLDIQMPGATGLEVAQRVAGAAHIVFVTAFDRYAVAAFEQGAVDYVLKPISQERVRLTIERLRARLLHPPADLSRIVSMLKEWVPAEPRYLQWLTVPHRSELRVLAVAEISYLQADRKYTTVFTPTGSFLLSTSLGQMRAKLDPRIFWQIHRSVVVNVGSIDRIYRNFRGALDVKLKGREELLRVSAAHAHLFRQ
jgi:DNA-binding LytR/AlgR family response regulator